MTRTKLLGRLFTIALAIAWGVVTPAFSKDGTLTSLTEAELQQTFVSNGSMFLGADDTEYKSVLSAVIDKWTIENNDAFKKDSLLAAYWLGKHELVNGSKEKALQIFDALYKRTRHSAFAGERAYALGAFLVRFRENHAGTEPDAKTIIAALKSEFGGEAGKLSLILKQISIFELGFLRKADDATVQSLIPTSVPIFFSRDAVPIAVVNRYDQEVMHLLQSESDPVVQELYVLKQGDIAARAWEMNNDIPRAVTLMEKFIHAHKNTKNWRVRKLTIYLAMSYAGITCGGGRNPEEVRKAKVFLEEMKAQFPQYRGKFLAMAESDYYFGQQQCAKM